MAKTFHIGDMVRVGQHRSFPGVLGAIGVLDGEPLPFIETKTLQGYKTAWWVDFEEEQNDGSDDGPYAGAYIEEDLLDLYSEPPELGEYLDVRR